MKRIRIYHRVALSLALTLAAILALALTACTGAGEEQISLTATAAWQAQIATRGVDVMPFDLEQTTHIFEKRDDGGLQQVTADDPGDGEQIALIRSHLTEEAVRFQSGDFHDPAMIHGEDMAGLHELVLGYELVEIEYSELPDGAQILYTTEDAKLVTAIHAWFDAQLADHAGHATGNADE